MVRASDVISQNLSSKTGTFKLLFLCYMALLLWYTVFSRPVSAQLPQLELFWSYEKWMAGDWELGKEILGNIGMFIPFGFLLTAGLGFEKNRFSKVLVVGILFSCVIEILQLELWRGLFEYDDIFNNALGTVLGYLLYRLLQKGTPAEYTATVALCFGTVCLLGGAAYIYVYGTDAEKQTNIPRSVCFQLDGAKWDGGNLVLTGFAFCYEKPSKELHLALRSAKTGREIVPSVTYGLPSPDVDSYFKCAYDYSQTGFSSVASGADPEEEYEIYMKVNRFVSVPTGVYVTGTKIHYVKQKDFIASDVAGLDIRHAKEKGFIAPDVAGTGLEEIVNKGYLRVYRPDFSCYVYQYKGYLYWIADKGFAFEEDGTTYVQYQLWTTQIDRLPRKRLKNKWYWDNIGGYFERHEITGLMDCGRYRVCRRKLPDAYAVTSVVTGYYKNGTWIWKSYFRPVYEF